MEDHREAPGIRLVRLARLGARSPTAPPDPTVTMLERDQGGYLTFAPITARKFGADPAR